MTERGARRETVTGEPDYVLCRCFGERIEPDRAFRLGCDKPGGCDELRDAVPDYSQEG